MLLWKVQPSKAQRWNKAVFPITVMCFLDEITEVICLDHWLIHLIFIIIVVPTCAINASSWLPEMWCACLMCRCHALTHTPHTATSFWVWCYINWFCWTDCPLMYKLCQLQTYFIPMMKFELSGQICVRDQHCIKGLILLRMGVQTLETFCLIETASYSAE